MYAVWSHSKLSVPQPSHAPRWGWQACSSWILLLAHLVDGHPTGQPPVIWAPPSWPGQLINDAEWLKEPFCCPLSTLRWSTFSPIDWWSSQEVSWSSQSLSISSGSQLLWEKPSLKTGDQKSLSTSTFSSSLVMLFPPAFHPMKNIDFPWPSFMVNVRIKTLLIIIFHSSGQMEF